MEKISVLETELPKLTRIIDTRNPLYRVYAAKENTQKWHNISYLVNSIDLTESDDSQGTLTLSIDNYRYRLISEDLFKARVSVLVFMGYRSTGLKFFNQYILDIPKPDFPASGYPTVQFTGKDMSIAGSEDTGVEIFQGLSNSSIAKRIAEKYNWAVDAECSGVVYEFAPRSGISEMVYLRQRARLDNAAVYLVPSYSGSGRVKLTLHYHPIRNTSPVVELWYRHPHNLNMSNLASFSGEIFTYQRGAAIQYGTVDTRTGISTVIRKQPNMEDLDQAHGIVKSALGICQGGFDGSKKIQHTNMVFGLGHYSDRGEVERLVESVGQSNAWIVKGSGQCDFGIPFIRATTKIRLRGLKRLSGVYYVKSASHSSNQGYSTTFDCYSVGTENPIIDASMPYNAPGSSVNYEQPEMVML